MPLAGGANGGNNGNGAQGGAVGTGGSGGSGAGVNVGLGGEDGLGANSAGGSAGNASCAAETADTGLLPAELAVAFDISGSMGKLDFPYHDPKLKFEPVVAAMKAFFADADAAGVSASLTFFPASKSRCDAASYATPDVGMRALPSTAFADAIDAVTPQTADDWRGGTPTLAIVEASFEQLAKRPVSAAVRALVLVTDGTPQGCDDDSLESVTAAVAAAAKAGTPTYVIGVKNPEGGPDTVSNLEAIAAAGTKGGHAIIVETGTPDSTRTALAAALSNIRKASASCDVTIPPPPKGETLDPAKVNVSWRNGEKLTPFFVDASCKAANAWRYDNAKAPKKISLCPTTCSAVQRAAGSVLSVEFGCAQRAPIIR